MEKEKKVKDVDFADSAVPSSALIRSIIRI